MGKVESRKQRKLLVCLLMLCSILFPDVRNMPKALETGRVNGIYVLATRAKGEKLADILDTPGVAGLSLNAAWQDIEPVKGQYNWTVLDQRIQEAAQKGKRVTLRIFPGISTPHWVYQQGAKPFEFTDKNPFHGEGFYASRQRYSTYGQTLKIPVPWDETFLAAWENFVAAFGAHYKDVPAIAMVHLTGPTRHSAEMHLPKEKADREQWLALGYTPQKLIGAWKRCMAAFAKALPHTPLVLNLSPVIFADEVLNTVVRSGHETYGRRLFLQNNVLLADKQGMQRPDWALLKEYATKTTVGFQRGLLRLKQRSDLSEGERLQRRRENFAGMLARGITLGAKYFEVGAGEVRDFPDIVKKVAEQLEKQS